MDGTQGTTGEGTQGDVRSQERSGPFGGLDPAEAGRASGRARREAAERRRQAVDEAKLTARQRLGLVLSELSVEDLRLVRDGLLRKAKAGDEKAVHALARLLDQSFGKAQPAGDEGGAEEDAWEAMSPAQRATWRAAALRELEEDGRPSGNAADPREG